MDKPILIAYATHHGSTADTADAIAGMLRERGLEADVAEAGSDALRELPVAYYAMGPKTSDPEDLAAAREQIDDELRALPDVRADPIATFGGVVDPAGMHFLFSHLPAVD